MFAENTKTTSSSLSTHWKGTNHKTAESLGSGYGSQQGMLCTLKGSAFEQYFDLKTFFSKYYEGPV